MLSPIHSDFSHIPSKFLPTDISSSLSEVNIKITTVAVAIFSAIIIATLLIIYRSYKMSAFSIDPKTLRPFIKPTPDRVLAHTPSSSPESPTATTPVDNKKGEVNLPQTMNLSHFEISPKFYETPSVKQDTDFTKLSEKQVRELLDIEPSLKKLDAAQGSMKAYTSILDIHTKGIPARLSGIANNELQGSMQFILYKISQESSEKKKKTLLLELAKCVEDCVPVTQGSIALKHIELASIGGFDMQFKHFISTYKEKAVDEVIYQLFPDMQNLQYAANHYNHPSKQFPHMKTGFLTLFGKELGLNMIGAEGDPNRNQVDTKSKETEFRKLFLAKMSIPELIREFIIDVNGRNGQFDINTLAFWCNPENLGEEAGNTAYDETFEYPSYSPAYKKEYGFGPYLTERSAYLIFEKLGYITHLA